MHLCFISASQFYIQESCSRPNELQSKKKNKTRTATMLGLKGRASYPSEARAMSLKPNCPPFVEKFD